MPQHFLKRGARRPGKSILDPYLPYLEKRVQEGCENGQQLWREILAQGYPGTSKQVMKWMQLRRTQRAAITPQSKHDSSVKFNRKSGLPSSKQLAWLLVRDPDTLTESDAILLQHLLQDPQLKFVYHYIHRFITMVKKRLYFDFDDWLNDVNAIPVYQLQTFVSWSATRL